MQFPPRPSEVKPLREKERERGTATSPRRETYPERHLQVLSAPDVHTLVIGADLVKVVLPYAPTAGQESRMWKQLAQTITSERLHNAPGCITPTRIFVHILKTTKKWTGLTKRLRGDNSKLICRLMVQMETKHLQEISLSVPTEKHWRLSQITHSKTNYNLHRQNKTRHITDSSSNACAIQWY